MPDRQRIDSTVPAAARHVMGISGGKDSSALAIYMRQRVPQMEYFFCDTGAELPETYEYLQRLEAVLVRDPAHRLELRLPPHEARERPRGEGLEACPRGPSIHQLKDLQRLSQPPDGRRTERFDLDHLLDEPESLHRQEDAPRRGQLFHAGRQMRGLADGGVVHVEIVADGPHHDLSRVEADADLHLSASNSMEPLRSAKSTVTCLRSPSMAALEVRIFSARCGGV